MSFKSINFNKDYHRSKNQDVLNQFYIPCLKEAKSYDRVTGFFSPTSLSAAAKGMASFIKNGGKYRLIFSKYIFSQEDYNSIMRGHLSGFVSECITNIDELERLLKDRPRKILGWMIANNYLEIKIGFKIPDDAIEHSKWGNFEDFEGNKIHYGGSLNETLMAWTKKPEHTDVYCDWDNKSDKERTDDYVEYFESLWNNKLDDIEVIDFPEVPKERFLIDNNIKNKEEAIEQSIALDEDIQLQGQITSELKNKKLTPRPYQKEAIDAWVNNGYKGIYALATGLGKTFTALFALKEFAEKNNNKYLCIIILPSTSLIYQWRDEIEKILKLDVKILRDEDLGMKWSRKLKEDIGDLNNGYEDNLICLATYNIYHKENFKSMIEDCDSKKIIICDEAHNAGSGKFRRGLLDCYDGRMALTATPERHFDEDGTQLIKDYFSGVVMERDLEWGIKNKFLSPYYYYAEEVDLTDEELIEYRNVTRIMMRYYNKNKKLQDMKFMAQAGIRALIIKNAQNKVHAFSKLIEKLDYKLDGGFIFCGSEPFLNQIGLVLEENNMRFRRFIAKDIPEDREEMLRKFKNKKLDAIIAMGCLDEGIDIPNAETAIILSSSSNSKQYIQRRGRVLRLPSDNEGKVANIYDFICIPPFEKDSNTFAMEQSLIRKQLDRFKEFSDISLNKNENNKIIEDISKDWELTYNEKDKKFQRLEN